MTTISRVAKSFHGPIVSLSLINSYSRLLCNKLKMLQYIWTVFQIFGTFLYFFSFNSKCMNHKIWTFTFVFSFIEKETVALQLKTLYKFLLFQQKTSEICVKVSNSLGIFRIVQLNSKNSFKKISWLLDTWYFSSYKSWIISIRR